MISAPLMNILNNINGYDIEGFRNESNTYTYYKNNIDNIYYCNRITTYIDLKNKNLNVYIITNSLSYYNKFKDDYNIKYVEYFIFDDYFIYDDEKTYTKEKNLSQIIGDYQILMMNFSDREFLYSEIDYIIDNKPTDTKLVISDINSYLNKELTQIDNIAEYISNKTNTIKFDKMHRAVSKYNYIPDLPLENESMMDISSIVFWPFHYINYIEDVYFKIPINSYNLNKETYDKFEKMGLLQHIETDKFATFKVVKSPNIIYNI